MKTFIATISGAVSVRMARAREAWAKMQPLVDQEAYQRGSREFEEGFSYEANPYPAGTLQNMSWSDGWEMEDQCAKNW